jgi:hypothetical protein
MLFKADAHYAVSVGNTLVSFNHLGEFERICLSAGSGCGYAGQNPMYLKLWKSLTK